MENFKSSSINGGQNFDIETYGNKVAPSYNNNFRSYSIPYDFNESNSNKYAPKEMKLKKGKSTNGSSSLKGCWILSDPEIQRKKRVAGYKSFALEGKMKGSFRKSFKWVKDRCSQVFHGSW